MGRRRVIARAVALGDASTTPVCRTFGLFLQRFSDQLGNLFIIELAPRIQVNHNRSRWFSAVAQKHRTLGDGKMHTRAFDIT